jgi:hypothetical protein
MWWRRQRRGCRRNGRMQTGGRGRGACGEGDAASGEQEDGQRGGEDERLAHAFRLAAWSGERGMPRW